MAIPAGTRLGRYEVIAPIGAGGMGDVYKALDSRLHRQVALKVLSARLADDPASRERFEREARTISSLDHPHICTLHDVGREGGVDFLVMQYLEGETLAARLRHGALPFDHALRCALEIASALDRAHRQGIVHRDLKPGNIMLTKTGAVLLDFGVAKLVNATVFGSETSAAMTEAGSIVGTLQYMAPEQLEGKAADARTDLFAFGAVLYEMLTGVTAFAGSSSPEIISSIMKSEPPAVSTRQPLAPPALDRVIRTCLAKDPDERFDTAHDLLLQLTWIAEGSAAASKLPAARRGRTRERWAWSAALALTAALALFAGIRSWTGQAADGAEVRLQIITPVSAMPTSIALSPNGRSIAFTGAPSGKAQTQLWVRPLDTLAAEALSGTEDPSFPFWSPDSRRIGFFADGRLKSLDVAERTIRTLGPVSDARGGTWNADGVILFAPVPFGPLSRVPEAGGAAATVTRLRPLETSHRYPQFLPDGRHFVYFVQGAPDVQGIHLASLDAPEGRRLIATDLGGIFAAPDWLLFIREGRMFAQRLDVERAVLVGDPLPVADSVAVQNSFFHAGMTASTNGVLAYRAGNFESARDLAWVDRTGKQIAVLRLPEAESQNCPELSPDGRRVAIDRTVRGNRDIWIVELARNNSATRLTYDNGIDGTPVWSPDGRQILYRSNRRGVFDLYVKSADGAGDDVPLVVSDESKAPGDWSPDGRFVLYTALDAAANRDLWAVPLTGDRRPFLLMKTPFEERDPQFSPDGRWIAYASNETGRFEVYVKAFRGGTDRWKISTAGGTQPRWRRNGSELFFVSPDGSLTAVTLTFSSAGLEAGTPVSLVPNRVFTNVAAGLLRQQYAASEDGQRFLVNTVPEEAATAPVNVILNWRGGRQQ